MTSETDKKNELQKVSPVEIDGIDGWEDRGDVEQEAAGSFLAGTIRLSFTNEATWIQGISKEPIAADFAPVVVNIERTVVDWSDRQRPVTRVLGAGERIPDLEAMNAAEPKEKWSTDMNGKPCGPHRLQYVTFLLDLDTLDRYSFPTSTVGGGIATRELVDKIQWVRRYRGEHVYPQVLLSDTFMRTRYAGARGGRQRPHFIIKKGCWLQLGGGNGGPELPAPSAQPKLEGPASVPRISTAASKTEEKPAPSSERPTRAPEDGRVRQKLSRSPATPEVLTQPGLPTVEEPSLAEELNDGIDF